MTLRQLREQAGLTQDQAAVVSRLSQGTISSVERGVKVGVSIVTIKALAKAYRCSVLEIIAALDETLKEAAA